eukprot:CAMPEP_0197518852 /NCGR_PEP_ID=MMETSP1318-20131121/4094_1 /TAXON_ID=552666 /ORGANISM="Partenskyella glossopodia, Strain RCC365" /LENGTH=309 /DNA_ID=CAMNT_0043069501 /DNA_START=137 /DNA_END=1063 /DNA_ORIENTATION=-
MGKQKRRKGSAAEKKRRDKAKNNQLKAAGKHAAVHPPPSIQETSEAMATRHFNRCRESESWVEEICEIAASRLSPKSSEKLFSFDPHDISLHHECTESCYYHKRIYPDHITAVLSPTEDRRNVHEEREGLGSPTPPQIASNVGNFQKQLYDRKAYGNATARRQTPSDEFVSAALAGDMNQLRQLRSRVDLDCTNSKYGWTAVMAAAGNGHIECLGYLVECKASLDKRDRNGWTAVMLAARSGMLDIVYYLVVKGADLSAGSSNLSTVYSLGHKKLVPAAIRKGLQGRREEIKRRRNPLIDWDHSEVLTW